MEIHRHTGHDLYFVTQYPTFIHFHIRYLVGLHEHLSRKSGVEAAVINSTARAWDVKDKSEKQLTDSAIWRFPKEPYSEYKSATLHTHKVRIPNQVKWLGVLLLCFVIAIYYSFGKVKKLGKSTNDHAVSALTSLEDKKKVLTVADSDPVFLAA